jgi:TonB-dependent starch-binding outer membrane protein SusC
MKENQNKLRLTFHLLFLMLFAMAANAQSVRITGKVTGPDGLEMPGVTVVIKGTTSGTITNFEGNYEIPGVPQNGTLVFSFVGMKPQEIAVAGKTTINVRLETESFGVDEVVVVGYGTQRRGDIAGSVATVKTDELIAQPTTDLQGMLKGKVAGLYVTMNDARPGGDSNVLLRGIRSLKGGNSPLYVVDGVALSTINELNIDDVESISVLKDASSQAIYGARASNGVILITTKRGSDTKNKVRVTYNAYYSIQNVDPNFEIFSPEEYYQLRREAYRGDLANAGNGWTGTYPDDAQMFTPLELESLANKNYVNWTDYAFKKDVPLTKHDISVSGGNETTQYTASLGYYSQDGIRMSSDLTRYTGRLTLDQVISKTFKTGLSLYYTTYTQNQETNSWMDFITFSPISKIYDEKGNLVRYPTGDGKSVNPLLYEETRDYEYMAERVIANAYLEITPSFLPGLKYKLNANINSRNRETNNFRNFEDPTNLTMGYASINFYRNKDYLVENILTYDKTFQDHKINATVMQGFEPRYTYSTTATALQLGNDFFGINSLGSALESEVGRGLTDRAMVSFMGRLNYSLMERYLFNFTVRADGSSVFGTTNKWGYFPSAAIAWNVHKESFATDAVWLNEAKFRLSYGQIGNQAISPYGSLATADNAFYVSGDKPVVGYLPGASLPNPNLRWETTTTLNTGLDFGILERRLSGSIEYYKSNTTDLLVDRQLPTVLGYSRIPANLGEIQNSGIETSLTGYIVASNDFNWSVTANYSKNKNKLIKGVLQDPETGAYIDDITNRWFIGKTVNNYYDYRFMGIWQIGDDFANSPQPNARPGDVRVADLSGPEGTPDGKITADDREVISRDPKWIGSLSTSISYKRFELSADLYTVQGVVRNNIFLSDFNHGGRMDGILNGVKRDYWTPENPSTTVWRPHQTSFSDYRGPADRQDASYIRLRNVTLAYNLPSTWLKTIGLSRVKIYASGDNLITKTEYSSYSPEGDVDDYPETKNFTFGLNVNF